VITTIEQSIPNYQMQYEDRYPLIYDQSLLVHLKPYH